ncbi:hypothetical protein ASPWEDRAFT_339836 [Aspergillus wentii DTO 134E9]|uniref:Uncharacterized protein n=1 Tax=Aspergillus wentii DTO 134E9 TaxID=1073089 RepID=A0A1L9RUV3_ASPWE|nr:uncharacterized protein ASPWEDRAFT_339836 [Aspergillus wentii DTO 134E9]OJJ38673.1 hypothetical protein ASPWEDRAFT_339836 [Aspergillus wentii DTO 134E9]
MSSIIQNKQEQDRKAALADDRKKRAPSRRLQHHLPAQGSQWRDKLRWHKHRLHRYPRSPGAEPPRGHRGPLPENHFSQLVLSPKGGFVRLEHLDNAVDSSTLMPGKEPLVFRDPTRSNLCAFDGLSSPITRPALS